jgi:hypothetical protein
MRWKYEPGPMPGETRTITKFLYIPTTARLSHDKTIWETRWWEKATMIEVWDVANQSWNIKQWVDGESK